MSHNSRTTCHWVEFPQQNPNLSSSKELKNALNILQKSGHQLKYGDLISNTNIGNITFNEGLCVYDGKKLVNLDYDIDDEGHLPGKFKVLVPHPDTGIIIPPRYWYGELYEQPNGNHRGISGNSYVWFDIDPYYDEIVANMHTMLIGEEDMLVSKFIINEETYYVIFDDTDCVHTLDTLRTLVVKLLKKYKDHTYSCIDNSIEPYMEGKQYLYWDTTKNQFVE